MSETEVIAKIQELEARLAAHEDALVLLVELAPETLRGELLSYAAHVEKHGLPIAMTDEQLQRIAQTLRLVCQVMRPRA